jgi:hypothetical protein
VGDRRLVEPDVCPAKQRAARSRSESEGRFNRVAVSFRSNLDFGHFLQLEPLATSLLWRVDISRRLLIIGLIALVIAIGGGFIDGQQFTAAGW